MTILEWISEAFDADEHPRGQPANAGWFASAPSHSGREASADHDAAKKFVAKQAKKSGVSKEVAKRFVEHAEAVFSAMPTKAVSLFNQSVQKIHFFDNHDQLDSFCGSVSAKARVEIDKGFHFGGAWDFRDYSLILDGHDPGAPIADIYAHEFAHAIDSDYRFTNEPEWKAAFKDELADNQLSEYGSTDRQEAFAEFGRLVYADKASAKDMRVKFPKTTAFWEKHGLLDKENGVSESENEAGELKPIFDKKLNSNGVHMDRLVPQLEESIMAKAIRYLEHNDDKLERFTHGVVTDHAGTRTMYHVEPHAGTEWAPKGFLSIRSVKQPHETGFAKMDYSHHEDREGAVRETKRKHDCDMRIGGGETDARKRNQRVRESRNPIKIAKRAGEIRGLSSLEARLAVKKLKESIGNSKLNSVLGRLQMKSKFELVRHFMRKPRHWPTPKRKTR